MLQFFSPDALKRLCAEYGIRPSSDYGQNYLTSPQPIEVMVEAAGVNKKDTIVEVGPGFGVLTFALVDAAEKVIAFEIEKKLLPYWNTVKKREGIKNLEIIWGNVLYEFEKFSGTLPKKYKVVANLPYQITSPILQLFLEAKNKPQSLTIMVQKEVAERICAAPGELSVLGLSVQYYGRPEIMAVVSRQYYWPEPKVDSAILKIEVYDTPEVDAAATKNFFHLAKVGFANRRKLLSKNLLNVIGKDKKEELKNIFSELGIKDLARAQELSLDQWKKLAKKLSE